MKHTEMLEWMSGLDARFLSEAEQPAIRMRKRKRLPVMIAAVAAAVSLTVGAAAYASAMYHRESVTRYFGTSGEQRITEQIPFEPVSYSNENGSVTVDAVINDGINLSVVMTANLNNGTFNKAQNWAPWRLLDADGNDIGQKIISYGSVMTTKQALEESGMDEVAFVTELNGIQDYVGQTIYLDYYETELFDPSVREEHPLAGIKIPISLDPNVTCGKFCAEDGSELWLSDFMLTQYSDYEMPDGMLYGTTASYSDGTDEALMTLRYSDGTEKQLYQGCSQHSFRNGMQMTTYSLWDGKYEEIDGQTPLAQIFMDTSDVTEVTLDGVTYYRQ